MASRPGMSSSRTHLKSTLAELFPNAWELADFLQDLPGGPSLIKLLPDPQVAPSRYLSAAVNQLLAKGFIDTAFIDALLHAFPRPEPQERIRRLAYLLDVDIWSSQVPVPTPTSPPQTTTPPKLPLTIDALILTALQDEMEGIKHIVGPDRCTQRRDEKGLGYFVAHFESLNVAVACTDEMGEKAVIERAGELITELSPRALAMCGICVGPTPSSRGSPL